MVLSAPATGRTSATPMTFDYDRDLWAIELGTALGSLEFAFSNHHFDDSALGDQLSGMERELTRQVETVLAGRGLGPLRRDYKDFGELVTDVLGALGMSG
jgi:hypothetical protein